VAAAALSLTAAHADVWHVDDSATTGLGNGLSWADAFVDLQLALSIAAPGDEIRIAQGVYRPAAPNGVRTTSFEMRPGVHHQGGFAGLGAAEPDALNPSLYPTILSGDLNSDDRPPDFINDLENSFHVVSADGLLGITPNTIFGGFTITGGRADSSGSAGDETAVGNRGGGMILLNDASPTVEGCQFLLNRANHFGGGLDAGTGSPVIQSCQFRFNQLLQSPVADGAGMRSLGTPSISNCAFEHNRDCCFTGSGGGLSASNVTIRSSTFAHNLCENGSGLFGSNLTLINCDFISNTGSEAFSTLDATLIDCRFIANQSEFASLLVLPDGHVTAIRCEFAQNTGQVGNAIRNLGSVSLINSVFISNRNDEMAPPGNGGAICNGGSVAASNCLFAGNRTRGFGGAIQSSGTLELVNCTIVGNVSNGFTSVPTGAVHLSSGAADIRNTILWQNDCPQLPSGSEDSQVFVQNGTLAMNNSTIEGWTGALDRQGGDANGNTGVNPMFVDADGADGIFGTADDNPRLQAASPARDTANNASLPLDDFDLDQDSSTMELISRELDDLRRLVAVNVDRGAYEYQIQCPADIIPAGIGPGFGDGLVIAGDLLHVIHRWGACPPAPTSCTADINGDDWVNSMDLLLVVDSWGPCTGLAVK